MTRYIPSAATTRSVVAAVLLGTSLGASNTQAAVDGCFASSQAFDADAAIIHALTRYCQACWSQARLPQDTWADCTQQVLLRLLETVPADQWKNLLVNETEDKRELLRAIDAVKKRTQRTKKHSGLAFEVAEPPHRNTTATGELWEEVAIAADKVLSDRQQQILKLSAHGHAVPEIAEQLGTTVARISDEKYKAIRKLRGELGVDAPAS